MQRDARQSDNARKVNRFKGSELRLLFCTHRLSMKPGTSLSTRPSSYASFTEK